MQSLRHPPAHSAQWCGGTLGLPVLLKTQTPDSDFAVTA
jgi:hypothetical protein